MAKTRKQTVPTLVEAPRDKITDAITRTDKVQVKLKRVNPGSGQWATVGPTRIIPTTDLLRCEDWIFELAGGGKYRVETTDPQDPTVEVVPAFYVVMEGNPKPLQQARQAAAQHATPQVGVSPPPGQGMYGNPYGYQPPRYYAPQDQGSRDLDPSMYWHQTPDAVAQENNRQLRADLEQERARHNEERKELLAKIDALTAQVGELTRRHGEEISRAQMRGLEQQLEMMRTQMNAPRVESKPPIDYPALIAAAVPLFTAMLTTSKDRDALQKDFAQSQMTAMTSLLESPKKGDNDVVKLIEVVGGLVTAASPLFTSMMDSRSPTKIAEMIATMSEGQMAQMGIVAQLLQSMMPEDSSNPWFDFAKSALTGVERMIGQAAELQTEQFQGRRPPLGSAGAQQATQRASQQQAGQNPMASHTPQEIANAIINSPEVPRELTTKAWYDIFVSLHSKVLASQVASQIAEELQRADEAETRLPPMFVDLFLAETGAPPGQMLAQLLQQIPIAAEVDYCNQVIQAFHGLFTATDEAEQQPPEQQQNGRDQSPGTAAPWADPAAQPLYQRT